ncbi:hypothetical protein GCM10018775_35960 [Streptomyces umbrinus]|nr:hypothetical protein GCM10018775_35960 [Streptomyces umbrinus]
MRLASEVLEWLRALLFGSGIATKCERAGAESAPPKAYAQVHHSSIGESAHPPPRTRQIRTPHALRPPRTVLATEADLDALVRAYVPPPEECARQLCAYVRESR